MGVSSQLVQSTQMENVSVYCHGSELMLIGGGGDIC